MTERVSPVRIVQLTPDDWAAYREIRLAALAESPSAFGSTLAKSRQYTEQIWRSRLTTATTFAAERDGRLVGIASGLPTATDGIAALIGMWVAPDARRQGIGEALVRRVIAWAEDERFTLLTLEVTIGNRRAEQLYERCGFTRTGAPQSHGDDHTTFTMEQRLRRQPRHAADGR